MSTDPKYTAIGCYVWKWPPYATLRRESSDAAHLWMVLYAGERAKTLLPGLWKGGVLAMADDAELSVSDATAALNLLIDRDMVEFEPQFGGVLRFTRLPDRCEKAHNQSTLKSWYARWQQLVPACGVRDRHLDLMAWIHLPFKRGSELERVWDITFGAELNARSASGAPPTNNPSGSSSLQLSLYSTPVKTHGDPHRGPHGLEKEKVMEKERGEVQERGGGDAAADPGDLWQLAKRCLTDIVTAESSDAAAAQSLTALWVEPLDGQSESGGQVIRMTAPSTFHRDRIRDRYMVRLQRDLSQHLGREIQIAI